MDKSLKISIPKNIFLAIAILYFIMCEFLPIINIIPQLVLSFGKLLATSLFFLNVYLEDKRLAEKFALIIGIVIVIHLLAFYNCWSNYTTIGSFLMRNVVCWLYVEIGIYLLCYGSKAMKLTVRNTILFFAFVTAITSIISVQSIPMAIRELDNGSKFIKGMETLLYLRNTSTWGGLYAMTFLLPYLVFWLKRSRKFLLLLCIAVLEVCILASQITVAVIISFFFLVFLFIKPFSFKKNLIIGMTLIVIFLSFIPFATDVISFLHEVAVATGNEVLALRTHQIYVLFSTGMATGTISSRLDLYLSSIESFLANPIIGLTLENVQEFSLIGLHSQVFDMMAATGLLGFIPLTAFFIMLTKNMIHLIDTKEMQQYFLMAIAMLVLLMFLNPTYYASGVYLSIFFGPSVFCSKKEL